MGLLIYQATAQPVRGRQWQLCVPYIFAANAPDLDFLPGLLVGDLSRFHHGPTHSIGFAVLFGILAGIFFKNLHAFAMGFSVYLSHVLLDYLVQDPSPPFGVPLFWPLSEAYFMAPFAFFPRFDYMATSSGSFLSALFTLHNFSTIFIEVALLLPLLLLVAFWKKSLWKDAELRSKPSLPM